MKLAIILSAFAICACSGHIIWPRSTGGIKSLIESYDYLTNTFEVQTSDGYILQMFRVSRKIYKREQPNDNSNAKKPAVLLFPGFLSDSEDFVVGGPTEGLAFYLVNQGYDVYLGNARGSTYGKNHTSLDPNKDEAFWRYSWHQIGTKDLPAIIDKVIEVSKQQKIHFVGHMEGSTASYVLFSEVPQYNNKVENVVSLGPIAFVQNAQQEMLVQAVSNNRAWIIKNFGISTFNPSQEIVDSVETECMNQQFDEKVCKNVYFLFNGYNSKNFNMTTVQNVVSRLPSTGSVRDFMHLVQLKKSGHFANYDENFSTPDPKDYDLSKMTVPVAILYTPNDHISQESDVQMLISKLPNVFVNHNFNEFSNNLDLIYANDVENVNKMVHRSIQGNKV